MYLYEVHFESEKFTDHITIRAEDESHAESIFYESYPECTILEINYCGAP